MADPFKDLPRGTPLRKITAGHVSGWNEAARAERGRKVNRSWDAAQDIKNSTIVKVRNASGTAMDQFAVMVVRSPIIAPADNLNAFKQNPALDAFAPGSPSLQEVVVVLQEPLGVNKIGQAIIGGLTVAQVDVTTPTTSYAFADVSSGATNRLFMANSGPARVIWKEAGTGVKWALVALLAGLRAGEDGFFAEITQRGPKPNYTYGFKEKSDNGDGTWSDKSGGMTGVAAAWADITQVTTTVANLVIRNATGGTFTVTANGTTGGQAYNVSAGSLQTAINGVLTGGVTVAITGSGTDASPFVMTFSAARTPTVNYASLTPNASTMPARELNNRKILVGTMVRMWPGNGDFWFGHLSTTSVTVCVTGGGSALILAGVPNDA